MTYPITLTGRPISVNHMWKNAVANNGKAFTYLTTEGKNTKEFWQLTALAQMRKAGRKIIEEGRVEMDIKLFFENRLRRDIDNYLKVILDSLTGVAYRDDSQIHALTIEKFVDQANPRIEIIIAN